MSIRFAPTDFRKPISRVFSPTETRQDIHDANAANEKRETRNAAQGDFLSLFECGKRSVSRQFRYPNADKLILPSVSFTQRVFNRINNTVDLCTFS